jgi:hypothetical protein
MLHLDFSGHARAGQLSYISSVAFQPSAQALYLMLVASVPSVVTELLSRIQLSNGRSEAFRKARCDGCNANVSTSARCRLQEYLLHDDGASQDVLKPRAPAQIPQFQPHHGPIGELDGVLICAEGFFVEAGYSALAVPLDVEFGTNCHRFVCHANLVVLVGKRYCMFAELRLCTRQKSVDGENCNTE